MNENHVVLSTGENAAIFLEVIQRSLRVTDIVSKLQAFRNWIWQKDHCDGGDARYIPWDKTLATAALNHQSSELTKQNIAQRQAAIVEIIEEIIDRIYRELAGTDHAIPWF